MYHILAAKKPFIIETRINDNKSCVEKVRVKNPAYKGSYTQSEEDQKEVVVRTLTMEEFMKEVNEMTVEERMEKFDEISALYEF